LLAKSQQGKLAPFHEVWRQSYWLSTAPHARGQKKPFSRVLAGKNT